MQEIKTKLNITWHTFNGFDVGTSLIKPDVISDCF